MGQRAGEFDLSNLMFIPDLVLESFSLGLHSSIRLFTRRRLATANLASQGRVFMLD